MKIFLVLLLLVSALLVQANEPEYQLTEMPGIMNNTIVNTTSGDDIQPLVAWFVPALLSAMLSGGVAFGSAAWADWSRDIRKNECAIGFSSYLEAGRYEGAVNMNFHSTNEDNWNYEKITTAGSGAGINVDRTKERVDGGRLSHIDITFTGTFCLKGILVSCENDLTGMGHRTAELTWEVIRDNWLIHNPRFLEVWWRGDGACLWTGDCPNCLKKLQVGHRAFTQCESNDRECIKRHLWTE